MILLFIVGLLLFNAIRWAWPRRSSAGDWRYRWPFRQLDAWWNEKLRADREKQRQRPGYWDDYPGAEQYWRAAQEASRREEGRR